MKFFGGRRVGFILDFFSLDVAFPFVLLQNERSIWPSATTLYVRPSSTGSTTFLL